MMNQIVGDTYIFNKAGGCPVGLKPSNLQGGLDLIQSEVNETNEEVEKIVGNLFSDDQIDALVGIADGAADVIVTAIGLLYRAGFSQTNVEDILSAVGEANKSKFDTNEADAAKSVEEYQKQGGFFDIHYEKCGRRFAIIGSYSTEKGVVRKILKSHKWQKPEEKILPIVLEMYPGRKFNG